MKKILAVVAILMLIASPALAQRRGAMQNFLASWFTVTTTTSNFKMPFRTSTERYTTRDIWIHNGSTTPICVDLDGGEIGMDCGSLETGDVFQIDGISDVHFDDFLTTEISVVSYGDEASPVSIMATY